MNKKNEERRCPKCGAFAMVSWQDLPQDEKLIFRLSPSVKGAADDDLKHYGFCTNCRAVEDESTLKNA